MTENVEREQDEQGADHQGLAQSLIVEPITAVIQQKHEELEREIEALFAALGAEFDATKQELRKRFEQIESALEVIAVELARRND